MTTDPYRTPEQRAAAKQRLAEIRRQIDATRPEPKRDRPTGGGR